MNKCTPILLSLASSVLLHAQDPERAPSPEAAPPVPMRFEVSPHMQVELDHWQKVATKWADHPSVVQAVIAANKAGPAKGLSNEEWGKLDATDPRVSALRVSKEALGLRRYLKGSKGALRGLILNGDRGHKVAFTQKSLRYLDAGQPVVDTPLTTGKAVQLEPEANAQARVYRVQVAVPVFGPSPASGPVGAPKPKRPVIGSLVVDVHLSHLARVAAAAAERERRAQKSLSRPPR